MITIKWFKFINFNNNLYKILNSYLLYVLLCDDINKLRNKSFIVGKNDSNPFSILSNNTSIQILIISKDLIFNLL